MDEHPKLSSSKVVQTGINLSNLFKPTSEEQVILELLDSVDLEACIRNPKLRKYLSRLSIQAATAIKNKISLNLKCNTCRAKRGVLMSCGHKLCSSCFPNCGCGTVFPVEDRAKLNQLKCLNCNNSSNFVESTCNDICARCMALEIAHGLTKCRICQDPYPFIEYFKGYRINCASPHNSEEKYLQTCELKCGHFFCASCVKTISKEKKCIVCNKNILENELYKIKHMNRIECENCLTMAKLEDVLKKDCCGRAFCRACKDQSIQCIFCGV